MATNKEIFTEGQMINGCMFLKDMPKKGKSRRAMFKCQCGNYFTCFVLSVKSGETRSCGCAHIKHGHCVGKRIGAKYSQEYRAWDSMKQRCTNPNNKKYKDYGARGITICERWFNSYENFFADIGGKPNPTYTLGRIDNDGNYEPSNCRWESPLTQ